ncbi:hypothetical protein TNCV_4570741 [Trichonephila clavipes]|nr:hypothetical protein TNCV_4570741 [Trichonephila clavipes]
MALPNVFPMTLSLEKMCCLGPKHIYTANARLVTQNTAYRILCRENCELAERLSNPLDSDYAYVKVSEP